MSGDTSARKVMRLSDSERSTEFDAGIQNALEEIDACQNEIQKILVKSSKEIITIERKYNKLRKPHYEKRDQLISTIPYFWITAIMNHSDLNTLLDESEEDCLHHLTRIEVEEHEDIKSGYFIKFHFEENPYFENSVLTKEYHLGSANPTSESTEIIWKDGCTLGQPSDIAKRKHQGDSTRTFFGWFTDNIGPCTDDIADIIKDDLWIDPLQYYLVPDVEGDGENGVEYEEDSSSTEPEEMVEDEENKAHTQTDTPARKVKRFAESDRSTDFDATTQKALEDIDACQKEIESLYMEATGEAVVVELKYYPLQRPIFEKRDQAIAKIPYFWITAIMNHPDLNVLLDDGEEDCLHHLIKLEVEPHEDIRSGYYIRFYFEENPYFENTVITKNCFLNYDNPRAENTEIIWKEGYALVHSTSSNKSGKKRRHESTNTFFRWFTDNIDPLYDDIIDVIKDDLWVNPLQYYLVPDVESEEENGTEHEDGSRSTENNERGRQ